MTKSNLSKFFVATINLVLRYIQHELKYATLKEIHWETLPSAGPSKDFTSESSTELTKMMLQTSYQAKQEKPSDIAGIQIRSLSMLVVIQPVEQHFPGSITNGHETSTGTKIQAAGVT